MEHLPWFESLAGRLVSLGRSHALAHANLLCGPPGVGKHQTVEGVVSALLCESSGSSGGGVGCGSCRACVQHLAGSHPDCLVVSADPETRTAFTQYPGQETQGSAGGSKKSTNQITVAQVREMYQWVTSSTHYRGYKLVVITDADRLNENASNALLKILEEPPGRTLFWLVTAQPARLLPTILSRCQGYSCPLPDDEMARHWLFDHVGDHENSRLALELARGAPVLARQYLADGTLDRWREILSSLDALQAGQTLPTTVAQQWEAAPLDQLLYLLLHWFQALIKYANCNVSGFSGEDTRQLLHRQTQRVHLKHLYRLFDQLLLANRNRSLSLNRRMQWEGFLQEWSS